MKDIKIFLKERKTRGEKKSQERHQSFTEEEKEEQRQYYHEHKNFVEEQNQRLVEYRSNYYITYNK